MHDSSHRKQANPCIDNCYEILKVERERKAKIQNDFLAGSKKRELEISQFKKLRTTKLIEASDLEKRMEAVKKEIEDIEGTHILGLKETYVLSRMATMKDLVTGGTMATALLSGLVQEELESLLVHLCQIAGEISKSDKRDNGESNCLALRVAALDLGLTWNDQENYEGGTTEAFFHNATAAEIVQIVFENAAGDPKDLPPLRWKMPPLRNNGRRRLDEIHDDDMMHGDDMMHDDEYEMNDDSYTDGMDEELSSNIDEETDLLEQKEFINKIRTSLFSTTRAIFLKESQEIIGEIDNILANDESSDNNDEIGEEESSEGDKPQSENDEAKGTSESAKTTIDPSSYKILRNNLRQKRDIIETGFRWGASAKLLVETSSFPSRRKILERLVIGTIFYGQIGAVHLWQIFQAILPEYKVLSQEFNKEAETICASPWAGNCPPKRLYREPPEDSDSVIDISAYPPQFIFEAAAAFCDEESAKIGKRGGISCLTNGNDSDIEDVITSLASLPSSEDDSFFGYKVPTKRDGQIDPFQTMFDPISKLPVDTQGWRSLEDERDAKEKEYKTLQNTEKVLWKEIGGRDGSALGRDGEFHSIANKCFEIVSNKYTYELCISGNAHQKDGQSKTSLGKFDKFEYVEDDAINARVLKWTNGAKCWNGPNRSATVHITCGSDHKLLSANEPDTCRYVFEMESYLGCDESYKIKMGL